MEMLGVRYADGGGRGECLIITSGRVAGWVGQEVPPVVALIVREVIGDRAPFVEVTGGSPRMALHSDELQGSHAGYPKSDTTGLRAFSQRPSRDVQLSFVVVRMVCPRASTGPDSESLGWRKKWEILDRV